MQRIGSMSLGPHIAISWLIMLIAMSDNLGDTAANFETALGNSNDRASTSACHFSIQSIKITDFAGYK